MQVLNLDYRTVTDASKRWSIPVDELDLRIQCETGVCWMHFMLRGEDLMEAILTGNHHCLDYQYMLPDYTVAWRPVDEVPPYHFFEPDQWFCVRYILEVAHTE